MTLVYFVVTECFYRMFLPNVCYLRDDDGGRPGYSHVAVDQDPPSRSVPADRCVVEVHTGLQKHSYLRPQLVVHCNIWGGRCYRGVIEVL